MGVDKGYRNVYADHLGQNHARPMECFRSCLQASSGNPRRSEGVERAVASPGPERSRCGRAISQWESEADMRAFWESPKRGEAMAVLQPFFVNQFTITNCAVEIAETY